MESSELLPATQVRELELPSATRLDSLTGLRFLAALMVFACHSEVLVALGLKNMVGYNHATSQGASGVSFFFILSGFVLAWSARSSEARSAFWRRRGARILPGYWFAWILGLGVVYVVNPEHQWHNALPGLVLLQSWIPKPASYFGGNSVGWSLSAEAFFYALFPLLIVVFRRWNERRQMIGVAVLLLAAIVWPLVLRPEAQNGIRYWLTYIFPPTRLLEFAVGMLLGLLFRSGRRSPVPFSVALLILVGAYIWDGFVPFYAGSVAVMVIPFALVIFTAASVDVEQRPSFARWPWLVKLGEWSYAFYLLHLLVITMAAWELRNTHLSFAEAGAAVIGCLAVSIALSAFVFHYIEKPLERRFRHDRTVRATAAPVTRAHLDRAVS